MIRNLLRKKREQISLKLDFQKLCKLFYFDKTIKRLNAYFKKYKLKDKTQIINEKVPSALNLISNINWEWISDGIPSQFHGDLQFENILFSKKNKFKLIDWRQDFSGNLNYGDIYYEFSKIKWRYLYITRKNVNYYLFNYQKKRRYNYIS